MLELHECKLWILNGYRLPIVTDLRPSHFTNAVLLMTQMTVIRVRCHKLTREKGGKKCEEQLNCLPVHQLYCRKHFHKMLVAGTTLSPYPQWFSCPGQIEFQHFGNDLLSSWNLDREKNEWHNSYYECIIGWLCNCLTLNKIILVFSALLAAIVCAIFWAVLHALPQIIQESRI